MEISVIVVIIMQIGATLGKVMIAQTLARRTWWDFNLSVMAHGRKALLNMMT